jgi:hypothetical protein
MEQTTRRLRVPLPVIGQEETTDVDVPPGLQDVPAEAQPGGRSVEADLDAVIVPDVRQRQANGAHAPWYFVQIWTRNRVYCIDERLTCVAVIDRRTGVGESRHAALRGRLVGGQVQQGDDVRVVHPLPVRGTQALFSIGAGKSPRFAHTSVVTRVIVRMGARSGRGVLAWNLAEAVRRSRPLDVPLSRER